jgi:PHD/YefM family antitoxin component YafN of YafNO toxin-antitoxin module
MYVESILPGNIHSLTDFLRHHKRHIHRLKRSRRPSVLTLNGKAEVVILNASAYQEMMQSMEDVAAKQGVAEGLASMEHGAGQPAKAVFARLRKKHGLKAVG